MDTSQAGHSWKPPQQAAPPGTNQYMLDRMETMFGGMETRLGDMEKNLGGRIDSVDVGIESRFDKVEKGINEKFTHVKSMVDGVSKKVDGLQKRVEENERDLDGKIDMALSRRLGADKSNIPPGMRGRIRPCLLYTSPSPRD